jgi:superfamily I DNA/RNA helicase
MTLITPELWRPQGVEDLEARAWEALREADRSVCVTAGAGAGKTEFLAQKATYLLRTGLCPQPKRILAISFKRDAARNLAERVEKRCPAEQARRFDSITFDAFTKGLVDRFRATIPDPYTPPAGYRIDFPTRNQLNHFLAAHGLHGTNAQQLERAVARTRLPFDGETNGAVRAYWDAQFNEHDDVMLSFPMINRLADWLLRVNPEIRTALQVTYPFVFLDEFQDTTYAQYGLLNTAFDGSDAIFTAVGDDKQRIMGWAGAMADAFDRFEAEYDARHIELISNWRSHQDLVLIQHVIARQIDPDSEQPEARAEREVDGDVAAIWEYDADADEVAGLASWIASEIESGINPHEIGILVRLRANDVEDVLEETLRDSGITLRNVARNVGDIAIQDLLGEELTELLIPLLRLGASLKDPESWNKAQRSIQFLEAIYPEDETGQRRLQDRLQSFVRDLRAEMHAAEPDAVSARAMAQRALDFVGKDALRRAIAAYQRDADFERVWNGYCVLLGESTDGAVDWTAALDKFEGLGQVALMTIHKSKGLEFHTMIFYGLDSQTWWSLAPNRPEELNSFFVAFTRAKQRAFFTFSAERGGPVTWIEELLAPADLHRIKGPT